MNDIYRNPTITPPVRIGITGLPNLTNTMVPGGLYVLVAETPAARFPLLASTFSTALKDGRRCGVILSGNPEHFVQRMESLGGVSATRALLNKQLQLFVTQEEFSKKMFRFGADTFVRELEKFDVTEGSYLVFDQADDLVSLHDISLAQEQFDTLGKWLMDRQVTALLVFLRVTETDAATLNALMDGMTGIMRLGTDGDGLRLAFDYWQSPEGTVAARTYQLVTLVSGQYEAAVKTAAAAQIAGPILGEETSVALEPKDRRYYYMDPDLGSLSTQVTGVWQHVDNLVGLMHATRTNREATVIFCYGPDGNIRQMAEAAHTLRINLGKHAQLIVQEKNASLRYQNEALLLRLGVNMVIHRDVPQARLPLLLDSVVGQVFSREVDIDFEAALASVTPPHVRGYFPPARFVREVQTLLDRSAVLNIPFVLGIGKPTEGVAMIDVLTSMHIARSGDLVTADHEFCYVFLSACQQTVILSTIERLLGAHADTLFQELRFQVVRDEVGHDLSALLHNTENNMVIDYTSELASLAPPPVEVVPLTPGPQVAQAPWSQASTSSTADVQLSTRPQSDMSSDEFISQYRSSTRGSTFGKSEVPRAKRSISNTN
jgi:cellulose biosynthesis protein BcsE